MVLLCVFFLVNPQVIETLLLCERHRPSGPAPFPYADAPKFCAAVAIESITRTMYDHGILMQMYSDVSYRLHYISPSLWKSTLLLCSRGALLVHHLIDSLSQDKYYEFPLYRESRYRHPLGCTLGRVQRLSNPRTCGYSTQFRCFARK